MMLVVTGVGFLIHLYATAYMRRHGRRRFHRFFAYLNLFCFAMLVLVMGDNLPVLFVGWEGVGLCSYLLIGFWYRTSANAAAGKKAFIANRIGDFGLLVGDVACSSTTRGALDWDGIAAARRRTSLLQRACRSGRSANRSERHARLAASLPLPLSRTSRVDDHRGDRRSASRSSSAAPARARRSRSTSGSPTRWPAPRRSPRSSTRPPWSPRAST